MSEEKNSTARDLLEVLGSMEPTEEAFPEIHREMAEPVDCFDDWEDEDFSPDSPHPPCFGDRRSLTSCLGCGGKPETEDHNPSRVFLDKPYPPGLPVVGLCSKCNNSHSVDEPYMACLIEAAVSGSPIPTPGWRRKARSILKHNKKLQQELADAQSFDGKTPLWSPDLSRMNPVLTKLARGHAAFELHEWLADEPDDIAIGALHMLAHEQRHAFEALPAPEVFPEVGSRAMNRVLYGWPGQDENGWVVIQPNRYRYAAIWGENVSIRIIIREYLAAEVRWLKR